MDPIADVVRPTGGYSMLRHAPIEDRRRKAGGS
jgi:hypothetical protein